ncbi:MAG: group II intron reverse transcriptase domain-containing protein [Sphingobacteriales bacterium]|nr:MAG: group II intron reverse transcriptase domain-containing protein [Sphingobacteriales bacterium]
MKTHKNLFNNIVSHDNLLLAVHKAQRHKRYKSAVSRFLFNMEANIAQLQTELTTKTYSSGNYTVFYVHEPKKRLISASPFRDRVVHHALCNIMEPLFERSFIYDSYANRKGKGTHAAIERCQEFTRRYKYVLKCDIRKFFPSIDHSLLKQEIRHKIACAKTLWLIDNIIDHSNAQEEHIVYFEGDDLFTPHLRRRGLPIGNLTSQFWANVYLNRFDHFVKQTLHAPAYIRYVDDFVIFSNHKNQLQQFKHQISVFLAGLRLILHPNKTHIHKTDSGFPFLGFRIFPYFRHVLKANSKRYKRHLRRKIENYQAGMFSPTQLESALNSWLGHIRFGQSKRLEYEVYWYIKEKEVTLYRHPSCSWRVLE